MAYRGILPILLLLSATLCLVTPEDTIQADGSTATTPAANAALEPELQPAAPAPQEPATPPPEDTAQVDDSLSSAKPPPPLAAAAKEAEVASEETVEPAQPPPSAAAESPAEPAAEVSAQEHPSPAATDAQPEAVAQGAVEEVTAETAPEEDMIQANGKTSEPPPPPPPPPSTATTQPPKLPLSPPGKLLVVPMDGSHWVGVKAVAQEMGRRGHEVTVVIPEASMRLGPGEHYQTLTYPVPYTREDVEMLQSHHTNMLESMNATRPLLERIDKTWTRMKEIHNFLAVTCESLLFNEELVTFLREQKFDAVLTDPMVPTGAILAWNLSVPSVHMLRGIPCGLDGVGTACPSPPSYVPRFNSGGTDNMGFLRRVLNFMVALLEPAFCKVIYTRFDGVASRFLQTDITVAEIFTHAPVWLLRYDFTMDLPRPLMPNMVLIGGINCAIKKPLTQELQEFVEGSGEHGIVVFTLGSMVASMPKDKADIFFSAFARIPQRVLWRYSGPLPDHVPDNIKVMKWLPQNDLLAHPKARAFITHGGTHGIYEGICNGVPMVMLPLFGDQNDNVLRVASRGVGVVLSIFDVTSDALVEALDKVINDSSYQEKMQKLSAIHNDRPLEPMDLAVYWTEFVMRHKGAEHLRPAAHDLNWVQYHSLDVLGFLFVVIATVVLVTIKCCSFCIRKCCGGRAKTKKD